MFTSPSLGRRTFLGTSVAGLLLLALPPLPFGCGGTEEDGDGVGRPADPFSSAFTSHAAAANTAHQSALDAIGVASQGFTLLLATTPPPIEVSGPQADLLAASAGAHTAWVLQAEGMTQGAVASPLLQPAVHARYVVPPGASPLAEKVGTIQSQLAITTALIVGGLLLTAYGAYKGTKSAVDQRAKPVDDKIQSANSAELGVINQSLNLPAGTDRETTSAHFKNLSMGNRLIAAKKVEQDLRLAEDDNLPEVNGVDAAAINQSVATSSVELGKTAVTTTVSVATTATGGQGYSQAMEAAGLSAGTAAAVDFGISAVSTASGQPLQPLDLLASHLDVAVVDKDKQAIQVPKPTSGMSLTEAQQTLSSTSASGPEIDEAMAVIALATANSNPEAFGVTENTDGTVTVLAPARVHITRLENPTNHTTFKVPDMGPADIVVLAKGKVPQFIENVDTTTSPIVSYEAVDEDDYVPPVEGAYTLLIMASPADPGPGESVVVTAQVNPAEAGIPVRLSVVGTDGYSNSTDTVTSAQGQATLHIPGGEEGVVDTVTVELPNHGVRQTVTYSF